jgi:hypothetical protein
MGYIFDSAYIKNSVIEFDITGTYTGKIFGNSYIDSSFVYGAPLIFDNAYIQSNSVVRD